MKKLFALCASALLVCALALSSARADGGTNTPGAQPTPTPCPTREACPDEGGNSSTTVADEGPTEPGVLEWLLSFIGL